MTRAFSSNPSNGVYSCVDAESSAWTVQVADGSTRQKSASYPTPMVPFVGSAYRRAGAHDVSSAIRL